jgi:hypothetical protein
MTRTEGLQRIILWAIGLGLLGLASRGLGSGYSYWAEELFSVTTTLVSWREMFIAWVLPDTHPPLYPIALKLWMNVFGQAKQVTRGLSFLFSTLELLAAAYFSRGLGSCCQLAVVGFLGTSPAFVYYSQKARNYALVLMLATLLTGTTLDLRRSISLNIPAASL